MRRLAVLIGSLSLAIPGLADPLSAAEKIPPQPVSGNIRWIYDYAAGKEEAKRTGRPMFVIFRCER